MSSSESSIRQCSFCAHANPARAQFCNACGSPLHLKACPACGSVDAADATLCGICGASFPSDALPATTPGTTPPKTQTSPAVGGAAAPQAESRDNLRPGPPPTPTSPDSRRRALLAAALSVVAIGIAGYLAYRELAPAPPAALQQVADSAAARQSTTTGREPAPAAGAMAPVQPGSAPVQPRAADTAAAEPPSESRGPAAGGTDTLARATLGLEGTGKGETAAPPARPVDQQPYATPPLAKPGQFEQQAEARPERPIALCDPARPHLGYCERQPRPHAAIILCDPAKPQLGYCMRTN